MAENPHAGHRERMKRKYLAHGTDAFAPHELAELLLFYAVPQKDVNPVAHRLIETFHSLGGIFSATREQLSEVEGVTPGAAAYLSLLGDVYRLCEKEQSPPAAVLRDTLSLRDYLWRYVKAEKGETVWAVTLNVLSEAIAVHKISSGSATVSAVDIRRIVAAAVADSAAQIVLAHNHPSGVALPSREDLVSTAALARALTPLDMRLRDHLIFTPSGECLSFRDSPALAPCLNGQVPE